MVRWHGDICQLYHYVTACSDLWLYFLYVCSEQLGFYSGTLFVTLMSVDRYLAIVHAVAAMRARTLCYGIIATVAIWVASSAMAAPQVVFASVVMDEEDGETFQCQPWYPDENVDFWKKLRNFSENTVGLFVCLPIMVFCYVKILLVLSKSRNSKKSKAVKLIFTIVCVFVVCWVPYNVVVFLQTLQMYELLNDCKALKAITSAIGFTEIIALSHCCLNPIIYAFVGEKFRKSMDKALSTYLGRRYWGIRHRDRDTTEGETSNTPVKSEYWNVLDTHTTQMRSCYSRWMWDYNDRLWSVTIRSF